ncbi:MAG: hypothetical protein WBV94_21735 [Blastocatellia bacterium]
MSTALTDIVNPVMTIVNASTTYGTLDDAKKFPQGFLDAMALDSDAETCRLLCGTPGHPLQKGFITSSSALGDDSVIAISGGGEIFHVINVKIDGVDARRKPVSYFKRLTSDSLSRTTIGKYYDIEDNNVIRHNGTSAVLKVVRFLMSGAPQAPDSLRNASIACMLSMVSSKMGTDVEVASYFAQQWAMRAQMIRGGEIVVPPVIAYQKGQNE